jgi:hypothetical protein
VGDRQRARQLELSLVKGQESAQDLERELREARDGALAVLAEQKAKIGHLELECAETRQREEGYKIKCVFCFPPPAACLIVLFMPVAVRRLEEAQAIMKAKTAEMDLIYSELVQLRPLRRAASISIPRIDNLTSLASNRHELGILEGQRQQMENQVANEQQNADMERKRAEAAALELEKATQK